MGVEVGISAGVKRAGWGGGMGGGGGSRIAGARLEARGPGKRKDQSEG